MIREDFLQYIWRLKKFNLKNLTSSAGQSIRIIDFGHLNTDAGPDFFNAKIKIDEVLWIGNVEIHVKSSDWEKHKHGTDPAYQNVILHVVLEEDLPVKDSFGHPIPCLILQNRIDKKELKNYRLLNYNRKWIPCEGALPAISSLSKTQAIEKALVGRLEKKAAFIGQILERENYDWEYSLLIILFRYFGMNINADAFEMLARSISLTLILKERTNENQLEALLFGQAGLLQNDPKDNYFKLLLKDYKYLQKKYKLKPINVSIWKFLRMRPPNFPTVRIAQLAALLKRNQRFFRPILEAENIDQLRSIFKATPNNYWKTHFVFNKISKTSEKRISNAFIDILIINGVIPYVFLYGQHKKETKYETYAIHLLLNLPSEQNRIITSWKELDIPSRSAFDSQGLIELKKSFCDRKKCLICPVGHEIMGR